MPKAEGGIHLYPSLVPDSRFFDLLLTLDEELADEARRGGCSCGGVLHGAAYERKPRGGPAGLARGSAIRFSFCCAREGCRRRVTPPSLRFLGRKVFFGVLVLLLPVMRDGPTPERLKRLCASYAVSVRTVRRWCRFWRETFVTSRVWQAGRGPVWGPLRAPGEARGLLPQLEGSGSRVKPVKPGPPELLSHPGCRR